MATCLLKPKTLHKHFHPYIWHQETNNKDYIFYTAMARRCGSDTNLVFCKLCCFTFLRIIFSHICVCILNNNVMHSETVIQHFWHCQNSVLGSLVARPCLNIFLYLVFRPLSLSGIAQTRTVCVSPFVREWSALPHSSAPHIDAKGIPADIEWFTVCGNKMVSGSSYFN